MSDVVSRANAALRTIKVCGGWTLSTGDAPLAEACRHYAVDSSGGARIAEFADHGDAQFAVAARSLVPELVDEVNRMRAEQRVFTQQSAAIAERNKANAEVEKLRGALETIRQLCTNYTLDHLANTCASTSMDTNMQLLELHAEMPRLGGLPKLCRECRKMWPCKTIALVLSSTKGMGR